MDAPAWMPRIANLDGDRTMGCRPVAQLSASNWFPNSQPCRGTSQQGPRGRHPHISSDFLEAS
jgi:hypothetical protein